MIKEILEQLAPLDAQIAALKGSGNEMDAITAHASELAELAVEEDELLRTCGPLPAEDRVFLARHPERPHIDETVSALFTDFFEQRGDRQCKEDPANLGGIARFHGLPVTVIGHRKGSTLEENLASNIGMPGPEGFASILWKDASRSGEACEMMKLTAQDLYSDGIVEQVIPEPLGGAQRSHAALFEQLDVALRVHLKELCRMSGRQLADQRYKKYRQIGETRNA